MTEQDEALAYAYDFHHSYAVLVGIEKYQHMEDLDAPLRDVERIRGDLEAHGYKILGDVIKDAEKETLLKELEDALRQAKTEGKRSRLLFYFAGHGHYIEKEDRTRLVPADGDTSRPDSLISFEELGKMFEGLAVEHCIWLLDCCHAGGFVPEGPPQLRSAESRMIETRNELDNYLKDPAWQVITSSGRDEKAWDSGGEGKSSPFCEAFSDFLRGDREYKDYAYTAARLCSYIRKKLAEHSRADQTAEIDKIKRKHNDNAVRGEYLFLNKSKTEATTLSGIIQHYKKYDGFPWAGFSAYEDQTLFYGREGQSAEAIKLLNDYGLVIVGGDPVSGKTSFVQAGLIPLWRNQHKHGSVTVLDEFSKVEELTDNLESFDVDNGLLVVDNISHLFSNGDTIELIECLRNFTKRNGRLIIVVEKTISLGFEGSDLEPMVYHLRDLAPENIREILNYPARKCSFQFKNKQFPEPLFAFIQRQKAPLAILSVLLQEEHRDALMQYDGNDELLSGLLNEHLNRVVALLSPEEQQLLRNIIIRSVQDLSENEGFEFRKLYISKLLEWKQHYAALPVLIEKLIKQRIFKAGTDTTGTYLVHVVEKPDQVFRFFRNALTRFEIAIDDSLEAEGDSAFRGKKAIALLKDIEREAERWLESGKLTGHELILTLEELRSLTNFKGVLPFWNDEKNYIQQLFQKKLAVEVDEELASAASYLRSGEDSYKAYASAVEAWNKSLIGNKRALDMMKQLSSTGLVKFLTVPAAFEISHALFLETNTILLMSKYMGGMAIWNTETQEIKVVEKAGANHSKVIRLTISPGGQYIMVNVLHKFPSDYSPASVEEQSNADKAEFYLYDVAGDSKIRIPMIYPAIYESPVAFSAEGDRLLFDDDIYAIETGVLKRLERDERLSTPGIRFSESGGPRIFNQYGQLLESYIKRVRYRKIEGFSFFYFYSCSHYKLDLTVYFLDKNGKCIGNIIFPRKTMSAIDFMVFNDDLFILIANADGLVFVSNLSGKKKLALNIGSVEDEDRKIFAFWSLENTILTFDNHTGLLRYFHFQDKSNRFGPKLSLKEIPEWEYSANPYFTEVLTSPGYRFYVLVYINEVVVLYVHANRRVAHRVSIPMEGTTSVRLSGKYLMVYSLDGGLKLFDLISFKDKAAYEEEVKAVSKRMAFDAFADTVKPIYNLPNHLINKAKQSKGPIFDYKPTRNIVYRFPVVDGDISADQNYFLGAAGNTVNVYQTVGQGLLRYTHVGSESAYTVGGRLSPNGQVFILHTRQKAWIYNLDGKLLRNILFRNEQITLEEVKAMYPEILWIKIPDVEHHESEEERRNRQEEDTRNINRVLDNITHRETIQFRDYSQQYCINTCRTLWIYDDYSCTVPLKLSPPGNDIICAMAFLPGESIVAATMRSIVFWKKGAIVKVVPLPAAALCKIAVAKETGDIFVATWPLMGLDSPLPENPCRGYLFDKDLNQKYKDGFVAAHQKSYDNILLSAAFLEGGRELVLTYALTAEIWNTTTASIEETLASKFHDHPYLPLRPEPEKDSFHLNPSLIFKSDIIVSFMLDFRNKINSRMKSFEMVLSWRKEPPFPIPCHPLHPYSVYHTGIIFQNGHHYLVACFEVNLTDRERAYPMGQIGVHVNAGETIEDKVRETFDTPLYHTDIYHYASGDLIEQILHEKKVIALIANENHGRFILLFEDGSAGIVSTFKEMQEQYQQIFADV